MKKNGLILLLALSGMASFGQINNSKTIGQPASEKRNAALYLTTGDQSVLLKKQDNSIINQVIANSLTIELDPLTECQQMDGFGFTLTGGSAMHLANMNADNRKKLLTELFGNGENSIGISYLRISIGASDLDGSVFSYNDLAENETDITLEKFSLEPDRKYLIPILKEITSINSNIKLLGSPWSPPVWMKTNKQSKGGSLLPEYYAAYALYFVKYIQQMQAEGLTIDAVTVQNEPLHPGNNPSMFMPAEEQAAFVKNSLGPAFKEANLTTKIIIYDHNADRIDYPMTVLNDPEAKKYIDGSAFHLYGGSINELSRLHEAHPDKNLYFTEQWVGANGNFGGDLSWHIQNIIIGSARNWCKVILEWNLAANSALEPHTPGGCTQCLGAITIDGDSVSRNVAYYVIAHASKFVPAGSIRIKSNFTNELPNVAFLKPDGGVVIIVQNPSENTLNFNIKLGDQVFNTSLMGGAVGSFIIH